MSMIYDPVLLPTEAACLRRWRADLLADVAGDVLEVGAGTGLNLRHYREGVARLVVTEPDPYMMRRLRRRARSHGRGAAILAAPAEALPFPDASFDVVVSTLVLCSAHDPAAALAEIGRVLRHGGRYVYIEHVAAPAGTPRRWLQGVFEPCWRPLAGGCEVTRETGGMILDAGFDVNGQTHELLRGAAPIVCPSIRGSATHV